MKIAHLTVLLIPGLATLFMGAAGWANIWIDEDFDDGLAFDASDIDTFDAYPPTTPGLTFLSEEGTLTTSRAFNGTHSYLLAAGQALAVGASSYENPTNGPYQYIQFAVSIGAIPPSGSMAEFRWNWTVDGIDYSFYIDFQSTGSVVHLLAGEDRAATTSQVIATLDDTSSWRYVTLQMQKNAGDATDSRTGQTLAQGMRFYVDSPTWKLEVPLPGSGAAEDTAGDWSLEVISGSLFLDDFYWEGGMTNGHEADSQLRAFGELTGCEFPEDYPVRLESAGVDPVYEEMLVPQAVGWLGSDVAHSISLSATQNLWLFADTFIGTITAGKRDAGAAFINSSIGIQDLTTLPPGNVELHWGPGDSSFFPHQPGTGGDVYWPTMGTMLNDELFIFCYNVTFGGPFGFSTPGTTLIRIPNPHDPPGSWVQNAYDLGIGDDHQGFHSAVYVEEPHLYLLGYDDPDGDALQRRAVLARALIADLIAGGTRDTYEFWIEGAGGPQWGASPDHLITLFTPGVTETGLQYDSDFGLFYCTTYSAFAPEIYLTTAPALTGPWSEPACVYQVPEHETVSFDIISYAVRPHPELSTQPGEMVLTYATNALGSIAPLFTEEGLAIYYPRFVRVQLSSNASRVSGWRVY